MIKVAECETAADVLQLARASAARRKEWNKQPPKITPPHPAPSPMDQNINALLVEENKRLMGVASAEAKRALELELKIQSLIAKSHALESAAPTAEFIRPSIQTIARSVCAAFDLTDAELKGQGRSAPYVRARQICFYLCRKLTLHSLPTIGLHIGSRDHTTVLHGIRKIESLRMVDAELDRTVANLESAFKITHRIEDETSNNAACGDTPGNPGTSP